MSKNNFLNPKYFLTNFFLKQQKIFWPKKITKQKFFDQKEFFDQKTF